MRRGRDEAQFTPHHIFSNNKIATPGINPLAHLFHLCLVGNKQRGIVMAVQNGEGQDLQSLFSLLADLERQLAEATDQGQAFRLQQLRQQCLLEIYIRKRNRYGKEGQPLI